MVSLARTGDDNAFEELVRRRQSWIRNLMRRLCGDPTLGDDLAQQVFLHAFRDLRRLRDPKKFPGWLKTLAVNTWRQHWRKNDALRGAEEIGETHQAQSHSAGIALDLERALELLSSEVRSCVVLSYYEGLSHGAIAELLEMPLGTVKSHIRRGTQTLKKSLDAYADNLAEESTS